MNDQVLGIGNQDACRLGRHFLPGLRAQLADEVPIGGICILAIMLRTVSCCRV